MNDDLQKQLAALLQSLMSAASDGATWAKGEIPLLVQEKIAYGRVVTSVEGVVFAVLCIVAVRIARRQYVRAMESAHHSDDMFHEKPGGGLTITASLIAVFSFFCVMYNLEQASMAWFAPRLYIIEWLTSMVTK